MEPMSVIGDISAWVLPVILAVTLHEAAHGWMAERFGDPTARVSGRVTFNPLKHIDPWGTLLLPGLLLLVHSPVLFGYAKPVPVDFRRLRPPRLGMLAVAAAGPGMNFLLALGSALLLHLDAAVAPERAPWLYANLSRSLVVNCALGVFNLLPILPLDGGRVLRSLLPEALGAAYARSERFGLLFVITLLMLPALLGITIVADALSILVEGMVRALLFISGNDQAVLNEMAM